VVIRFVFMGQYSENTNFRKTHDWSYKLS